MPRATNRTTVGCQVRRHQLSSGPHGHRQRGGDHEWPATSAPAAAVRRLREPELSLPRHRAVSWS